MAQVDDKLKSSMFVEFWRKHIDETMKLFGDRANTYSSLDLQMIGFSLMNAHQQNFELLEQEMLGVLFYLQGKIARAMSAMFRGQLPTADTLDDLIVYGLMLKFRYHLACQKADEEQRSHIHGPGITIPLPEKLSDTDIGILRRSMQDAVTRLEKLRRQESTLPASCTKIGSGL